MRLGIGSDPRIGFQFIYPGCGYGGSCFPKDVKALIQTAVKSGFRTAVLDSVEDVNQRQKERLFEKMHKHFGDLRGKTIALRRPTFIDKPLAASLDEHKYLWVMLPPDTGVVLDSASDHAEVTPPSTARTCMSGPKP